MALLELRERAHDLLRQVACAAHPLLLRRRPNRGEPHVEALAPRREVAESVLVLTAEIHAEDPALREVADHPSDTVGGVLDVHPTAPAATAFGKDEHGLSAAEQVDAAAEHAGYRAAVPPARHGNALHEVDEEARRERAGEVPSLRDVPWQRRVVCEKPRGRAERPGDERRVDHGEMVRTHEERPVASAPQAAVLAARRRHALDAPPEPEAHQRDGCRDPHRRQQAPDRTLHREAEPVSRAEPARFHRRPRYASFDEISRTASPTVLTASTSSSAISMPNSSSNASTTSTRRAEFTLRSSRMCVIGPTRASASLFFAYGVRIPTTLFITSVSLTRPLLPSGGPLPEDHAGVDVAEAEACLG